MSATPASDRAAPSPWAAAHLMAPDVRHRLQRLRLHRHLDMLRAQPGCRAIWVGAAAGAGKTTLAATYRQALLRAGQGVAWLRLDGSDADPATVALHLGQVVEGQRALTGGAAATGPAPAWPRPSAEQWLKPALALLGVARAFWAALPSRAMLVLDDVDSLPATAAAPLLAALLAECGQAQGLLLLARCAPPPALLVAQADGRLLCVDADTLRFDDDEAAAWSPAALPLAARWPLAAALLAETDGEDRLQHWVAEVLWPGLPAADQALLHRVAWLPVINGASLAAADQQRIAVLARQGLLVDRCDPSPTPAVAAEPELAHDAHGLRFPHYRLHGLLQQHLQRQQRAERPAPVLASELARLAQEQHDAAHALALWRQAIALDVGVAAQVDDALVRQAPDWLGAGRHAGLCEAIAAVPAERRSARLWWQLAQAEAPRSPVRARNAADQALTLLRPPLGSAAERALALQCQSLAIATQFQAFDDTRPLQARLSALQELGVSADDPTSLPAGQAGVAVAVWSALFLREPGHPACAAWQERVHQLLFDPGDANLKLRAAMLLAKQAWYAGRYADIVPLPALVQGEGTRPGVTPYARLLQGMTHQYAAWASADWTGGLDGTGQTLAESGRVGIDLLDRHFKLNGACFASLAGDEAQAHAWLDEVAATADPARRMETWHHFGVRSWLALRQGDDAAAEAASRVAIDAGEAMGPAPLAMVLALRCHALQALGDVRALAAAQGRLQRLVAPLDYPLARLHLALLHAQGLYAAGDEPGALVQLGRGLALVRQHQLYAPFGVAQAPLARLLALAIDAGEQPAVAARLARSLRLCAPSNAGPGWPWPLRVFTLGRFVVEIDGVPLAATGKQQRRPLELLQALIAAGGEASAAQLADQLWPEAEGDLALQAFEVALRRLRRLLCRPGLLRLHGGRLALDRAQVWVDVLSTPAAAAADAAFLPGQQAPWALVARARLLRAGAHNPAMAERAS